MEKAHYYFDMPDETYNFIIKKGLLRESKKEKTILDLCLQGEPIKSIMIKTGYSQRTVNYRKKEIYEKIQKYLKTEENDIIKIAGDEEFKVFTQDTELYNIYLLTFPNGKVYVGITSQIEKNRWKNGKGYISNNAMYNDILKYGWQNIKKDILFKDFSLSEAREKEKELIIHYRSHLKKYGYNRSF